jgi:hypothetical protein
MHPLRRIDVVQQRRGKRVLQNSNRILLGTTCNFAFCFVTLCRAAGSSVLRLSPVQGIVINSCFYYFSIVSDGQKIIVRER